MTSTTTAPTGSTGFTHKVAVQVIGVGLTFTALVAGLLVGIWLNHNPSTAAPIECSGTLCSGQTLSGSLGNRPGAGSLGSGLVESGTGGNVAR